MLSAPTSTPAKFLRRIASTASMLGRVRPALSISYTASVDGNGVLGTATFAEAA
jgi:hypothetical protein